MSECPRLHSSSSNTWLTCSKDVLVHIPAGRHIHIARLDGNAHSVTWDSERVIQTVGMFAEQAWEVVLPTSTASSLRTLLDDLA